MSELFTLPTRVRSAFERYGRDLAYLSATFGGRSPSPVVPRARRPREEVGRAFVVERVVRETEDAVTLELAPEGGGEVALRAGQFFTVHARVLGRDVKRNYSASSSPRDRRKVDLTVKRVPGGEMSTYLTGHVSAGDTLRLEGPFGAFVAPPGERRLVLVGGGSGITPLLSIARDALAGTAERVHLVYANRRPSAVVLAGAVAALERDYPGRFTVTHVLEEDAGGARSGRFDVHPLAELLAPLEGWQGARFFVCGPEGLRRSAEESLAALGVPRSRVHVERFTTASAAAPPTGFADQVVTLRRRGRPPVEIGLRAGETLLAATRASGRPIPSSCEVGGCGACRVRLVSGEVAMEDGACLGPAERAEGWVLGCVSRPLGPVEIEVDEDV